MQFKGKRAGGAPTSSERIRSEAETQGTAKVEKVKGQGSGPGLTHHVNFFLM